MCIELYSVYLTRALNIYGLFFLTTKSVRSKWYSYVLMTEFSPACND